MLGTDGTSPLGWSDRLGRSIRIDGPTTIGTSTQTLVERALRLGEYALAKELGEYYSDEIQRMNDALYTWLVQILAARSERRGVDSGDAQEEAAGVIEACRAFAPASGDLTRFGVQCDGGAAEAASETIEIIRVRLGAVHDLLVSWIQELLSDVADRYGDDAVLEVVVRTYERLWAARYAHWPDMSPLERLQLSVEGMRGHLSGRGRRGDVGVVEEDDRYIMVLDPCGSCGVLRRGDPDSGRAAANPAGTTGAHPWAWGRVGLGWYAVHSAIVMEWLQTREGKPPMRPLLDCDTDKPCKWFVYKRPEQALSQETLRSQSTVTAG